MKKYIFFFLFVLLVIYNNVNISVGGNKKSEKFLPELNAYSYYKKAIELIEDAKKAKKERKWDIYYNKMEESIKLIKEGNEKPFFIPLKEYKIRISTRNQVYYNENKWLYGVWLPSMLYITTYRRVIREYGDLNPINLSRWQNLEKQYEFKDEKEVIEVIEDLSAIAKYIQTILYSPIPFPFRECEFSKTKLKADLETICKEIEVIYKKYKIEEVVKELDFLQKKLKSTSKDENF